MLYATYAAFIIVSYLLGSVPFGLLLTKWMGKGDIRKIGSGSPGATNVSRVAGISGFIITWVLDMGKAILAFMLAKSFLGANFGALCGAIAVVGHIFPVWMKFKGGKGLAPMFGFMLALNPIVFATQGLIWLLVAISSGYSSAGALAVLVFLPVFGFAIGFWAGIICIFLTLVGLWAHRLNIKRLWDGEESKMQLKLGKLALALILVGLLAVGLMIYLNA
ncbi:MAG: glycerol-3-phosphate 1-O-acyltransferase PlsY [Proteobacteria bacterium]|nr:glycerol-3-phosphate 1-O-acyltransferase PlsY [Pseudomonadota bacterium]